MLNQKETLQFRSLLKDGLEHDLLLFIAKAWMPKGSAEVVVRSVEQQQSLVLELSDNSGQNAWFAKSLFDTPLHKYLHANNGSYMRFVIPLEEAGWIRHKNYDNVDRTQFKWMTISDNAIYRKPVK